MALSQDDRNFIRRDFLVRVKDGVLRSRIMAVAAVLSEGEDDEEDAYLSVIGHLSQPENADELQRAYDQFVAGGATPYLPEGNERTNRPGPNRAARRRKK